jgi:ribosomal protein S12 methylthiotransferase
MAGSRTFYVETLGCPKNQVDSDKLIGTLLADGMAPAGSAEGADLVVVNTCAFIEDARQESIDVVLDLAARKGDDARLVVTGCLAERYGDELAAALPEADAVAGFGVPVTLGRKGDPDGRALPSFDLLNLPRPAPSAPWAYVKVAEGCDKACGFCAIPSFRGPQRSRTMESLLAEVDALAAAGVREVVLVAQDLASYGRDQGVGERSLVPLIGAVAERVDWVRMLYLYPSHLDDALVEAICATGVPYFDLSLQHVAAPLVRRMRRWGDGAKFLARIEGIRAATPEAAFRSNFIVGYPGETEAHHDELLEFVRAARLDWCGFFAYSREDGTYAADLDGVVPRELMAERLAELRSLQDDITALRRDEHIGEVVDVLVDAPGIARSHREAPEIDGIITGPESLVVGTIQPVRITGAAGPDSEAEPLTGGQGRGVGAGVGVGAEPA